MHVAAANNPSKVDRASNSIGETVHVAAAYGPSQITLISEIANSSARQNALFCDIANLYL